MSTNLKVSINQGSQSLFDLDPSLPLLRQVVVDVICPLENLLTSCYASDVMDLSSFSGLDEGEMII